MNFKKLTSDVYVSGQIQISELCDIAEQGIKTVINNRPNGEAPDQPDSASIAEAAQALGLQYRYIPVTPGSDTTGAVVRFAHALASMEGPMLAFCRSGSRSTILWALASTKTEVASVDEVIQIAAKAGYDLESLRDKMTNKLRPKA